MSDSAKLLGKRPKSDTINEDHLLGRVRDVRAAAAFVPKFSTSYMARQSIDCKFEAFALQPLLTVPPLLVSAIHDVTFVEECCQPYGLPTVLLLCSGQNLGGRVIRRIRGRLMTPHTSSMQQS